MLFCLGKQKILWHWEHRHCKCTQMVHEYQVESGRGGDLTESNADFTGSFNGCLATLIKAPCRSSLIKRKYKLELCSKVIRPFYVVYRIVWGQGQHLTHVFTAPPTADLEDTRCLDWSKMISINISNACRCSFSRSLSLTQLLTSNRSMIIA